MIALLCTLWSAHAETIRIDAEPTAVVVFADRARVTRSANVTLGVGRQEVVFENLPMSMITDGITADAPGNATLRGIDLKAITATQAADRRVKEIDAAIEELSLESVAWSDEAMARRVELTAIEAARSQAASQLSAQLLVASDGPKQASTLRTSLSSEDAVARAAIRVADGKKRTVDEKIAALSRERDMLGSSATDTWTATVHLDVERAGTIRVELDYLVSGAQWTPRYDVRGNADTGKVDVALSAMVQQTSGEDWSDVKLTVSSARPSLGTIVPVLDPFWLRRPVYYPQMEMATASRAPAPARAMKAAEAGPAMDEDAYVPMQVAQATVDTQLAATTFVVARTEDIPNDGTERKVLLTTQTLDAKLQHVVVPRLDLRAYLVSELTNTADFPLLAGTAGVFLAGSYLGDMELSTVAPGEKFEVAFGVDDGVTVRRTPRKIDGGAKALVGKRATSRWEWDIRIRNGHKRPIDVLVKEQVPMPSRDDIKVSLRPSNMVPMQLDGGLLDFRTPVAAGAEVTINWGYDVDYPSDVTLGWME